MNTRELIQELQNQKEMLGKGFFDQELLEKYLDASYLNRYNKNEEDKEQIKLFGLDSIETLHTQLVKIYPYAIAKPRFNKIKGNCSTLYRSTNNPSKKINITIKNPISKQKQKTFKQDKAA